MSSSGLKLAVRYCLPPFRLGFCGPCDRASQRALCDFASGKKISEGKVQKILEKFEAMYPYLCLIASSNKISDPFDERVARAFWVGNKLLDRVEAEDLRRMIMREFTKPKLLLKKEAEERTSRITGRMVPHHSFHVLVIGSVTGRVDLAGPLKELCRIGWGKVVKTGEKNLLVQYQPLVLTKKPPLGKRMEKALEWDRQAVPGIKVSNWVSFHWGQVCERLSEGDLSNLKYYTKKTIQRIP